MGAQVRAFSPEDSTSVTRSEYLFHLTANGKLINVMIPIVFLSLFKEYLSFQTLYPRHETAVTQKPI
jgi:hypothetical protein